MDQITKSRIKDGLLTLPQSLARLWQNREVVIYPEKDRFIVQALEAVVPPKNWTTPKVQFE